MPYGNNSLHVCPNDLFPITGAKYFWLPYTANTATHESSCYASFLDIHFNQTKAHYLLPTQLYDALIHTQNRAPVEY